MKWLLIGAVLMFSFGVGYGKPNPLSSKTGQYIFTGYLQPDDAGVVHYGIDIMTPDADLMSTMDGYCYSYSSACTDGGSSEAVAIFNYPSTSEATQVHFFCHADKTSWENGAHFPPNLKIATVWDHLHVELYDGTGAGIGATSAIRHPANDLYLCHGCSPSAEVRQFQA